MIIYKDISLKPYNTFGIDVKAKEFIEVFSIDELKEALNTYSNVFPLGGGSNLLLTKNVDVPILKINIKGIEIAHQDDDFVWVTASAGENWNDFVQFCIEHNYGGLENLSLIPGNVGTSPIQNIGAYGVEIKDVMYSCQAMNINNQSLRTFTNEECSFGYRESVFKSTERGKYIIVSVTFKLTKRNHQLKIDYGTIRNYLLENGITSPTLKDVSKAVISIRQSKLPDFKILGNSGSFFKNPIVAPDFFEKLKQLYPNIPHYIVSENEIKIPAAWLIESCGFKGYRQADAGVHHLQSLVLINYGNASGEDIYNLAKDVQKNVWDKYKIHLEIEVNVV